MTYTNMVIVFDKVVNHTTNTNRSRRNQLSAEIFLMTS